MAVPVQHREQDGQHGRTVRTKEAPTHPGREDTPLNGQDSHRPGARPPRRRGQGELEAQVLSVLHTAPGPVSAAWVQERLDGNLAYTTVVTILSRLLAKEPSPASGRAAPSPGSRPPTLRASPH